MSLDSQPRRIAVLRESVARKIAAGEVIDRPFSIVRELLDNSLDAKASLIEVAVEAGGVKSISVRDNGFGMSREDLELCWLPHATSKIETEDDLTRILSLGFRGEALAAVAACTRLSITSSQEDSGLGHRLVLEEGQAPAIKKYNTPRGTLVHCQDLFYSVPARKNFLKSPGSEGTLCRKMLEEKALAFPEIAFRFLSDGQLKLHLTPQSLRDRYLAVAGTAWPEALLKEFHRECEGFSLTGLVSSPHLHRTDRREIQIYVNRRKIQEYSLVQAVCHAYEGALPGGFYPYAAIFLSVSPDLVDFNIHPAKKEARFRNLSVIHHELVEALKDLLSREKPRFEGVATSEKGLFDESGSWGQDRWRQDRSRGGLYSGQEAGGNGLRSVSGVYEAREPQRADPEKAAGGSGFMDAYRKAVASQSPDREAGLLGLRYLGQIMDLFLVVEMDDTLYLIDQHAAHERLLFEGHKAARGRIQELLIPVSFTLERNEGELLRTLLDRYRDLGIGLREVSDSTSQDRRSFELVHLPQSCVSREADVVEFICSLRSVPEDLEKQLYATMSCRAAIMDGDILDRATALSLIQDALRLEDARCPHGRPVWIKMTRRELYTRFGRIIG